MSARVIAVTLMTPRSFPVFPELRTFSGSAGGMSQKCQEATFAAICIQFPHGKTVGIVGSAIPIHKF
jgi:hypothetical protein